MNAEILAVGTEILIGSIVNTNAQYLSKKLAEQAVDIYRHTTVGDNIERLIQALDQASDRASLLITTGGLGPTEDDITAQAVAKFAGRKLILHKPTQLAIIAKLKRSGRNMTPLIERQCWLPQGALVFQNDHGTAPSTLTRTTKNGKSVWVLCLPGPPRELRPLFEKKALPALLKNLKLKKQSFLIRTLKIAAAESTVAEKVSDLLRLGPPVTLGIYAKPGLVELKIMCKDQNESKARAMVKKMEMTIRKRLGVLVYGVDEETLSDAVGKLLRSKRATLALAESCTGGLVGHELTQSAGASDYFKGSIVSYANHVKTEHLSVPISTLKKYGAVSQEVAWHMAKNVRIKLRADYGVAITGIAGPDGGTRTKPVGLVYIGIASANQVIVDRLLLTGDRSDIKHRAALKALNALRLFLLDRN